MTEQSSLDVALLAFGGPATSELVPDFLKRMSGRQPDDGLVSEVQQRYLAIGGGSPLPDITHRQAAALQAHLVQQLARPARVRAGFLFADPSVAECLKELDGHDVVALPMSPYRSRLTTDAYRKALSEAGAPATPLLDGWHTHPGYVGAVSERIAQALNDRDVGEYAVLFTAHNVPVETVMEGDPYVQEIQETIAQLLPVVMPGDWRLAFQSKGRRGGEWLEPEVGEVVARLAGEGWTKLLVVPVGFVADHVETLYDLDIVLRGQVEDLGMSYLRSEPPNDSPRFIEALTDIVLSYLTARPVRHPGEAPA